MLCCAARARQRQLKGDCTHLGIADDEATTTWRNEYKNNDDVVVVKDGDEAGTGVGAAAGAGAGVGAGDRDDAWQWC